MTSRQWPIKPFECEESCQQERRAGGTYRRDQAKVKKPRFLEEKSPQIIEREWKREWKYRSAGEMVMVRPNTQKENPPNTARKWRKEWKNVAHRNEETKSPPAATSIHVAKLPDSYTFDRSQFIKSSFTQERRPIPIGKSGRQPRRLLELREEERGEIKMLRKNQQDAPRRSETPKTRAHLARRRKNLPAGPPEANRYFFGLSNITQFRRISLIL